LVKQLRAEQKKKLDSSVQKDAGKQWMTRDSTN
jgi:hypothetical protein